MGFLFFSATAGEPTLTPHTLTLLPPHLPLPTLPLLTLLLLLMTHTPLTPPPPPPPPLTPPSFPISSSILLLLLLLLLPSSSSSSTPSSYYSCSFSHISRRLIHSYEGLRVSWGRGVGRQDSRLKCAPGRIWHVFIVPRHRDEVRWIVMEVRLPRGL